MDHTHLGREAGTGPVNIQAAVDAIGRAGCATVEIRCADMKDLQRTPLS